MSSMFLTKVQRELIKFQRIYTLSLKKPKKKLAVTMRSIETSTNDHGELNEQKFKPEADEIDARLYDEIIDLDLLGGINHKQN